MKRSVLFLALGFCLITTFAYAEIKGEVKNIDFQNNKIRMWVQYFDNNVILETGRAGNYDYQYLEARKMKGKTKVEIKTYIEGLIKRRCERILLDKYKKVSGHPQANKNREYNQGVFDVINKDAIKTIINSTTSVKVLVDSDSNGMKDKKITINYNGTITEENIVEIPIPN